MPNRLKDETSPYLRQHMDNPVDWYPWGTEAFARAKKEDKPILLSIGYSACHWCHVMAHESFENNESAAQMNRDFINIKVDREEHPDVDQIYQHALSLFNEHGGWPLTMFLLPSGEPFFGGTYFPPRDAYGRPGFRRVLFAISTAYKDQRGEVTAQAEQLLTALQKFETRAASEASFSGQASQLPPDVAERGSARLLARIDRREGGFAGAPKFPNPTALSLFLRAFGRRRDPELAEPALLTLRKMAAGGIYDQLGGGFARYSTDAEWLVPHFEKMLYDNAQLLRLYAEAHHIFLELGQTEPARRAAEVIEETHGWLEREMRDAAGGFYAAQDADSEGVEGKYFVWSQEEIAAVLDRETAELFCLCYDVRKGGNWQDPHGHGPRGKSILHIVQTPKNAEEAARLQAAKSKLLKARSERIPPGTDDKILCGWNGLAVTGLAEAGRLLEAPHYVQAAQRTADFILSHMRDERGRLLRTFKNGVAKLPATLDDYAFFAEGLFHLASASSQLSYLMDMRALMDVVLRDFYDREKRLFYLGPAPSAEVPLAVRPVSYHDTAIPSGVSVACMNLLRLSELLPAEDPARARYREVAEEVLLRLAEDALRNPFGLSNVLSALDLLQNGLKTLVVVAGSNPAQRAEPLLRAAAARYVPDLFVLVLSPSHPLPSGFAHLAQGKSLLAEKATAYVCCGPRCTPPITDPELLGAQI